LIVEKQNEPDHAPEFEESAYDFNVIESAENSTLIGHIRAFDRDVPEDQANESTVQYTLLGHGSQQ
jgi:hypothetical protein